MPITPSGVSLNASLNYDHRIYMSEVEAGRDNPSLNVDAVDGTTVEVESLSYTGKQIDTGLHLTMKATGSSGDSTSIEYGHRARQIGEADSQTAHNEGWEYVEFGSYELTTGVTGRWANSTRRLSLLEIEDTGGDTQALFQLAQGNNGTTNHAVLRLVADSVTTDSAVDIHTLLGLTSGGEPDPGSDMNVRWGIVIEYDPDAETLKAWMADASSFTGPTGAKAWIKANGTQLMDLTSFTFTNGAAGLAFRGTFRGFQIGSGEIIRKVEAYAWGKSSYDIDIDFGVGLGSLINYDEESATEYSVGVLAYCPPGRFDTTSTEVWMQLQESANGSSWSNISGTVKQLDSTHFMGSARTGTLNKADAVYVRAMFYADDPAAPGAVGFGAGPTLSPQHGDKIASIFCHDHSGSASPMTPFLAASDISGVVGVHVEDDYGYPTGQAQEGNAQCTTVADFYEVYRCILLDPHYAEATRDIWVQVCFGDHNWGIDGIDADDWLGGSTASSTATRWDGSTTETHANITSRARQVIHDLFQSCTPNPQAFNDAPGSSGYDWWYRFGGGHVVYCMESVAHRGNVADSLASNSTDTYPGTSLDQEAAFGSAMANVESGKYGIISTVRISGPDELVTFDNWGFGNNLPDGFARLVAEYNDNAPSGALGLVGLTGDRHFFECNVGLNGMVCELTCGPANVRAWATDWTLEANNNGASTVLAYKGPGVIPDRWARQFGVIDLANGISVAPVWIADNGTATQVAATQIVASPNVAGNRIQRVSFGIGIGV